MRHPARRLRRALGTAFAGLAALVVLGLATPAAAQVSVDPSESEQGGAVRLNFRITNESPATMTKVEFRLPTDAPIAEAYPLAAEDWAPQITTRTLDKPIPGGMHGTEPLTQVTASITYFAMDGKGVPPGGAAELALTFGGLPTVAQLVIGIVQTNADNSEVRYTAAPGAVPAAGERPAVVVTLKPAPAGAGQGQHANQGSQHDADTAAGDESGGYGRSALWGALAAALAVGALFAVTHLRQRVQDRRVQHLENVIVEDSDKENESESEDALEAATETTETVTAR